MRQRYGGVRDIKVFDKPIVCPTCILPYGSVSSTIQTLTKPASRNRKPNNNINHVHPCRHHIIGIRLYALPIKPPSTPSLEHPSKEGPSLEGDMGLCKFARFRSRRSVVRARSERHWILKLRSKVPRCPTSRSSTGAMPRPGHGHDVRAI